MGAGRADSSGAGRAGSGPSPWPVVLGETLPAGGTTERQKQIVLGSDPQGPYGTFLWAFRGSFSKLTEQFELHILDASIFFQNHVHTLFP